MKNEIIRAVVRLGIDYFRWTQLVPMLAAWGFLLACLLAIAFTSFETQGMAVLESVIAILGAIFQWLPERLTDRAGSGPGELSGDDFIAFASWAWFILSAIAMFLNWLVGERLRPAFLKTLRGRISTAGIVAAAIAALLILIRISVPENFNGSFASWLLLFIGGPLIVWIVSVYSLSVSALLSVIDAGIGAATRS